MSKIIEFLDQAGRDAALRHATREQLLRRMSQHNIGDALQDALLRPQQTSLATLIGARETMGSVKLTLHPRMWRLAHLEKYAGENNRNGSRGFDMGIREPGMKRDHWNFYGKGKK